MEHFFFTTFIPKLYFLFELITVGVMCYVLQLSCQVKDDAFLCVCTHIDMICVSLRDAAASC